MTSPARRQLTFLEPAVRAIETARVLDPAAKAIGRAVRSTLSTGRIKDAISGTWLGHAVHPMLTDVVIGSFLSASLLDLLGGEEAAGASERLITVGIAAYAPTALTGVNDWADTEPVDETIRRAGIVHASTNAVALSLYVASLTFRRQGARGKGIAVGALGAATLMAGGYLGGHLSLNKGVGPDQTVFDPGPTEWTAAADGSQLSVGQPTRTVVGDTPVLVVKAGAEIFAIHDRCSHRGCSLSDGQLEGHEIVCACHGSRFDVRNGSLRGGPATSAQPAFEVRERQGILEVRRTP